jgi:hypothetical protein
MFSVQKVVRKQRHEDKEEVQNAQLRIMSDILEIKQQMFKLLLNIRGKKLIKIVGCVLDTQNTYDVIKTYKL